VIYFDDFWGSRMEGEGGCLGRGRKRHDMACIGPDGFWMAGSDAMLEVLPTNAKKQDGLVGPHFSHCREDAEVDWNTASPETERLQLGPRSPRYHFMANLMVQSYNANAANAESPFYAVSILSAPSSFLSSLPALASPS